MPIINKLRYVFVFARQGAAKFEEKGRFYIIRMYVYGWVWKSHRLTHPSRSLYLFISIYKALFVIDHQGVLWLMALMWNNKQSLYGFSHMVKKSYCCINTGVGDLINQWIVSFCLISATIMSSIVMCFKANVCLITLCKLLQ